MYTQKKKLLTKEKEKCEDLYKNTTKRDETGRHIVHLPLRQSIDDTVKLCRERKQQAVNNKHFEKKFKKKNEKLKTEYTKVIHEQRDRTHEEIE